MTDIKHDCAATADVVLNPAARLLWRARDVVQLEMGDRAMVVEGAEPEALRRLGLRQRAASPPDLEAEGDQASLGRHVVSALTQHGLLWPEHADIADDLRLRPPVPRLAADLEALAARHGEGAAERLTARRNCTVAVHGSGRVAVHLAALLGAAGVGRVHITATDDVRLHHSVPGGLAPADEGQRFLAAATAAVRRAAPDVDTGPAALSERPDLAILAIDEPVDSERRDALHARGTPHLAVRLSADHGVVGPLVIPGRSSCLHCADLHRRDRDPGWPALAVQLTVPRRHGPASDVALATVIAGSAALQALTYLDGEDPATIDGTIELHLPDWRLRRRSWAVHPDCDCAAGRAEPAEPSAPGHVSYPLGTMAK